MDKLRLRLINCFAAVFPNIEQSEIETLNAASIAEWDSVVTVTLMALVEEEFNCSFDAEEFELLVSFEFVLTLVEGKVGGSST